MRIKFLIVINLMTWVCMVESQDTWKYSRCDADYCMYSDGVERTLKYAISQCASKQMYLLEIQDLKTAQLFDAFASRYFPLSKFYLNAEIEYTEWCWINDRPLDRGYFWLGDYNDEEAFASLEVGSYGNLTIAEDNIDVHYDYWICSRQGDCPPEGVEMKGRCYFVRGPMPVTYFEALEDCSIIGASLASFDDLREVEYLKQLGGIMRPLECYWIGLSKNIWRWTHSRKVLEYNRWKWGKMWVTPCVVAKYSINLGYSEWCDCDCDRKLPSICMARNSLANESTLFGLSTESVRVVVAIGWLLAVIFLVTSIVLLILLIIKTRKSSTDGLSAPKSVNRLSVYPANNTPKNLPDMQATRSSANAVYTEGTNYYEEPTFREEEEPKYTELIT